MGSKRNILSIKKVKKNGKLLFKTEHDLAIYRDFVKSLDNGQVVEQFLELQGSNGSNAQLAKIHACIKELALECGYTFNRMKTYIKTHAGLCWLNKEGGVYCRSFADCTIDELGLVIESIIEVGDEVNINFRGHLPQ